MHVHDLLDGENDVSDGPDGNQLSATLVPGASCKGHAEALHAGRRPPVAEQCRRGQTRHVPHAHCAHSTLRIGHPYQEDTVNQKGHATKPAARGEP